MNEYLSVHDFGGSSFTDIFPPSEIDKYRDAKLSKLGHEQANGLMNRLKKGKKKDPSWTQELDLIVVSPLTRAIQTFELGIQPVLEDPPPLILALPLASERVYLISDVGRPREALRMDYGSDIDFETGFRRRGEDDDKWMMMEEWWFGLDDQRKHAAEPTGITSETYKEWRPGSQNQKYACPGEPKEVFEQRMRRLYEWLQERPESTICVVCHCGVIAWFMNRDFENCEVQVVPFSDIRPSSTI